MDKKALAHLVKRANKGNLEAFSQIYNEFYKPVFYIGLKITGNEYDAGDVVQETMLCLYKDLPNIKDPNLLVALVNRIATCRSVDILRAKKRVSVIEEDDEAFESGADLEAEFIPQEYVERAEQRELVLKAVEALNEEQKAVILLFYYEDLPIKEIAHILDVSESLVGTRLFRARKAIKQKLEQKHWGEGGVLAMVMPALSKILKMDADMACSNELCSQHWLQLAEKAGIPLEAATAVMSTAAANAAAPAVLKTTFSLYKIAVAAAASIAVAGAGFLLIARPYLPPPQEGAPVQIQQKIIPQEVPTGNLQLLLPEDELKEENLHQEAAEDIPVQSLPSESQMPAVPADTPTANPDEEGFDGFTISNRILSYPQDTNLSIEQILSDGGVALPAGMTVKTDFEEIDTSIPDDYGLYVWVVNDQGVASPQKAIIIKILPAAAAPEQIEQ